TVLPGEVIRDFPVLGTLGADYTYFNAFSRAENLTEALGLESTINGQTSTAFSNGPQGSSAFHAGGEVLANNGNRLLLTPRLSLPLRLFDYVEVLPEAGYREALYQSDLGVDHRAYITGRVDLRTRLRNTFDLPLVGETTHLLEPRIGYALLAKSTVSNNP